MDSRCLRAQVRRSPSPSKAEQDFRRNAPSAEHQARMQQLFEKPLDSLKMSKNEQDMLEIDGFFDVL